MRGVLLFISGLVLYGCIDDGSATAQRVIDNAIKAHGSHHFKASTVSFRFRELTYSVTRIAEKYVYTRSFLQGEDTIRDVLVNSSNFARYINGTEADLPDSMKTKYSNSVNSVLYFMQLPYLLNDPAVNKTYHGETSIKGERYDVVKVTFDVQDGGRDFEDEYMYWVNQSTHKLDYLAYNYQTDGGGARFRAAYNRLERGGILFQDYVNYEAPVDVPLHKLPKLFEQDKLKELSRIENEDIKVEKS